jgi:tRNA modification GTPase
VSDTGPGTERQKALIDRAIDSLVFCLAECRDTPGLTLDLLVPGLRDAVNALGEITGEVSTADILELMFGKFCVGK